MVNPIELICKMEEIRKSKRKWYQIIWERYWLIFIVLFLISIGVLIGKLI